MNKTDLIDAIASAAELNKKQAKAALEATLAAITGSLKKGEPVQLIGFGTFKVNKRAARTVVTHKLVQKSKSQHLKFQHLCLVKH